MRKCTSPCHSGAWPCWWPAGWWTCQTSPTDVPSSHSSWSSTSCLHNRLQCSDVQESKRDEECEIWVTVNDAQWCIYYLFALITSTSCVLIVLLLSLRSHTMSLLAMCFVEIRWKYDTFSHHILPYPTPPYPTLCYLILCYPMLSYHTLSYPTSGIYSSPILPFLLLSYPTLWYSLTSPPSSCSCSSSPTLSYLMLPYALLCSPIHLHLLSADSFIGFFLLVL